MPATFSVTTDITRHYEDGRTAGWWWCHSIEAASREEAEKIALRRAWANGFTSQYGLIDAITITVEEVRR